MNKFKTMAFGLAISAISATSALAATLHAAINVDNQFTAYIGTDDSVAGTAFLSGTSWPTTYNGSTLLTDGVTNYLHIRAVDVGGPAAFLGSFSLSGTGFEFANGAQQLVTGEGYFSQSESGWGPYSAVTQYGSNGVGPWGVRSGNADDAIWIWSDNNDSDNVVYFTASINSIAPVPLPAGLPLLLAGLGAFGVMRKRRG